MPGIVWGTERGPVKWKHHEPWSCDKRGEMRGNQSNTWRSLSSTDRTFKIVSGELRVREWGDFFGLKKKKNEYENRLVQGRKE